MSASEGGSERFPRPPLSFTDQKGREVTVETYDGPAEPLVAMYNEFDKESRAQGTPPISEPRIREWVEELLEDGLSVVARHDDDLVGHAVLLPYEDTSELAIFVHPEYQSAGIGTELMRGLLGYGQANDIEHVWLMVSRDNRIAMRLYRSTGFETQGQGNKEFEMHRDL